MVKRNWRALLAGSGVVVLSVTALPIMSATASPGSLSGPQAFYNGPNGNSGNITSCSGGTGAASVENAVQLLPGYTTIGVNAAPYITSIATDSQASSAGSFAGGNLVVTDAGSSINVTTSGDVIVDYVSVHGGNSGSGPSTNVYWGPATRLNGTFNYVASQGFSGWLVCYNTSGVTSTTTPPVVTTTVPPTTTPPVVSTTVPPTTTPPVVTTTVPPVTTPPVVVTTVPSTTTPPVTATTTGGVTVTTQIPTSPATSPTTTAPNGGTVTTVIQTQPSSSPSTLPAYHIPTKAPSTGAGGAASTGTGALLGVSGLLLLAGLALMSVLVRRRRA